ncbi:MULTISPECIES: hypothetical protein [Rhodococcus]|uniref:hypothetical protein n=1 Tax=Rhodococcus TaxID=1827 RepID=UPI001E342FF7|nr:MULTISPECIES: hypothetical protein [Rhodococcus]BDB63095.1 hypothetical protein RDE2_48890 [Rhodococcus sp. RDE2]
MTSVRNAQHDSPNTGQGQQDTASRPTHIADDTIRWPDPSPLDGWWARVMGKSVP